MNCKKYETQIDELGQANLSAETLRHLANCPECRCYNQEHERLQHLLQSLETVNAPADFNFRVKASLRGRETLAVNKGWRKLMWIAPTALAAVACGFAIVRSSFDAAQFQATANSNAPQIIALIQPTPAAKSADDQTATPHFVADDKAIKFVAPVEIAKSNEPKLPAKRRAAKYATVGLTVRKNDDEKEVIKSRMVSVRPEQVAILPPGIPNPLKAPKKLDAKQLLLTLGVKTNDDDNGLRVVSVGDQAGSNGLQADDIIEKINHESVLNVSGNSFQELNLTVRRQQTTQQVKLTAKP